MVDLSDFIQRWDKYPLTCLLRKPVLICTFISLLSALPAAAFNQDQLWLPRDYYRHFRSLYQAAEISEQTERCRYVIAGTISQERSSKEHPVFVVTCRDHQRQTFAYIIDGLSQEILNLPPQDPEAVAQEALRKKLEQKWLACYEQIKQRTQGLLRLNLSQDMPQAVVNHNDDPVFQLDFNAASSTGDALHYRAHCQFNEDRKTIDIHPLIQP